MLEGCDDGDQERCKHCGIKGSTHPRFAARYVGVRIVTVGVARDTKRISTLSGAKVSQTSHHHLTIIYMHHKQHPGDQIYSPTYIKQNKIRFSVIFFCTWALTQRYIRSHHGCHLTLKSNGFTIGRITISITPIFLVTETSGGEAGIHGNGMNLLLYRLNLITIQYLRFPYSRVGCS